MARYLLWVFVTLLPSIALAGEDTYLLFDVEVSGHRDGQPVYLAIGRIPKGFYHLRIERHIFPISAGQYRLDHIDFHERGGGISLPDITTRFIGTKSPLYLYPEGSGQKGIKIDLQEGYINYLGILQVEKNGGKRFELKFVSRDSLLQRVCSENSDLIAKKQIKMVFPVGNTVKYTIDCNRLTK